MFKAQKCIVRQKGYIHPLNGYATSRKYASMVNPKYLTINTYYHDNIRKLCLRRKQVSLGIFSNNIFFRSDENFRVEKKPVERSPLSAIIIFQHISNQTHTHTDLMFSFFSSAVFISDKLKIFTTPFNHPYPKVIFLSANTVIRNHILSHILIRLLLSTQGTVRLSCAP